MFLLCQPSCFSLAQKCMSLVVTGLGQNIAEPLQFFAATQKFVGCYSKSVWGERGRSMIIVVMMKTWNNCTGLPASSIHSCKSTAPSWEHRSSNTRTHIPTSSLGLNSRGRWVPAWLFPFSSASVFFQFLCLFWHLSCKWILTVGFTQESSYRAVSSHTCLD